MMHYLFRGELDLRYDAAIYLEGSWIYSMVHYLF